MGAAHRVFLFLAWVQHACWAFLRPPLQPTFARFNHHNLPSRQQLWLSSAVIGGSGGTTRTGFPPIISIPSQRVQKLKDVSFQKEVLKDITAAEFALQVEIKNTESTIDYDRLILKLQSKLGLLEQRAREKNGSEYQSLVERLKNTQRDLIKLKEEGSTGYSASTSPAIKSTVVTSASSAVTDSSKSATSESDRLKEIQESLRVIVREDGTVDWDGARATGKEVAKFGTELWERLNGKEDSEGLPSVAEIFGQVQAKAPETEELRQLAAVVAAAKQDIDSVLKTRNELRSSLRVARRDGKEILPSDVLVLQGLDARVKELEKRLRIATLDIDMERICVYLQKELESSVEPLDQRIFIAEVALLDKQLSSIVAGVTPDSAASGSDNRISSSSTSSSGQVSLTMLDSADLTLVDEDELALIIGEVNDLKSRLGLDAVAQMDWGSLGVLVSEGIAKIKTGFQFYGEGTKLLISDVQYAGAMLAKAVSGTTLKPREVNTVRRTGKDLLTLIPFTIILIIPLSPVGHVLVFSFIQRFFPEFYPSCYTDKRMNLRRLYSEIERKGDDGLDLGEEESAPIFKWDFFNWMSKPDFGLKG